ncbi:two-component system sensor histidine kinase NtrB [Entomobacter blattae]|uniref:histidine kinase n=1 Tax=Entomobacter blattae TaxID=2762277 RepID=A0A7H1NT58_9PROT|nr:ATP-binding protein [Entomobacter blattae]QNT78968.1 Sensory histidine kinase/phosphatase NtrB [Entomobacter blattae]
MAEEECSGFEVTESLSAAVLVVEPSSFHIHYANPSAESFFCLSRKKLITMRLDHLLWKDHQVFFLLRQVLADRNSITAYEVDFKNTRFSHENNIVEVIWLEKPVGFIALVIHQFLTEKKMDFHGSIENDLKTLSSITSSLMHEIRNPLSGIKGAAQLLENTIAIEEDRALATLIRTEVDRIKTLVDQMEQFEGYGLERREVNIHQILDHVKRLLKTSIHHDIIFQELYDPSLPPVWGNQDQLIQVFLNLMKNAAESIMTAKGKGVITLKTAYRSGYKRSGITAVEKTVAYLPILISIHDTGHGISEASRPYLFDSFFTTKKGGKGLGLALSGKIIAEHGGIIEVGTPNVGAEFMVRLPYRKTV